MRNFRNHKLLMSELKRTMKVQRQVRLKLEHEVAERTEAIENVNLKLQLSLNRARVDPHFIFNVLNSIQHLVLEEKPREASEHLAQLSRLTRYILEKSCMDEVTVKEEVAMLAQYIKLEQLRLDYKFTFEIIRDIDDNAVLPAMLIQPYVENAIMNRLAAAAGKDLRLRLLIRQNRDVISVVIEDNGEAQKMRVDNGENLIGSTTGTERLQILSKLDNRHYSCRVEELYPDLEDFRATRVTLSIPVKLRQIVL